MNVPETMNEVLDMSDDEGMKISFQFLILIVYIFPYKTSPLQENVLLWFLEDAFSHSYIVRLTHAVRKANTPEMLSDGEYLSDGEEGICQFLLW